MAQMSGIQAQAASLTSMMGDAAPTRLSHAVIIPQRRPKKRVRGFIRAYAPDLMYCGIDQAAFMTFLDGFNAAVAASPWVGAINLAGEAVGAVPGSVFGAAPAVGFSIQLAAGIYTEISARKSQNAYLLKMNDEFFRPRGLYCLIMAYDTNSRSNIVQHDLGADTSLIPQDTTPPQTTREKFRGNDGVVGAAEFPPSAELIFPDLDDALEVSDDDGESDDNNASGGSSFTQKMTKAAASFAARKDRKSQVKFLKKNPTSAINPLMDPRAELTPKDLKKQAKREIKQEHKREKDEQKAEKRLRRHPERAPRQRKIKQGILYLMIVNMPSEEDMNNAQRLLHPGERCDSLPDDARSGL